MKILVTGWSGTGKTTVCKELQLRGLNAYDADAVPGLSSWCIKNSEVPAADRTHGDYTPGKYDWNWNSDVLRKLLDVGGDIYVCGNANNATRFYPLFDRIFVLDLPETEQRRRMMARIEHNYGQDKGVQDMVIAQQAAFVESVSKLGLMLIDASASPETVANNLLAAL